MITAIEGNRGEKVDRRVIPLGWGYIRGYAAPQYEKAVKGTSGNPGTGKKSVEAVAKEVLAGKWGNGEVNNPVPVSLLSGDRKPQIRFLGNHHSGSGNLYHKSFRM